MTYLIVGNNEENIKEEIKRLISKLWERDLNEDIFESKNPDIHILEGSNIKSIGIEDVKNFQKNMVFTPFKELVQIGIVFNSEKLTPQAQNSFLKTLEENSNTTAYILVTESERSLLPTVISRCSKIYTKESSRKNISKSDNILKLDLLEAFQQIESISKSRDDTLLLLKDLHSYFQEMLEKRIHEGMDIKDVHESISKVSNGIKRVEANGNKRLVLESIYIDLTR